MKLWLTFKTIISVAAIFIGAYIFSTMSKDLSSFEPWAALIFMLLLAVLPWFPWKNYEKTLPTPDHEPPLFIIKNIKIRGLVTKILVMLSFLIGFIVFASILMVLFNIYPISIEFLLILVGLFIMVKYTLKEHMPGPAILGGISAGPYKRPLRIVYFICALSLVLLMTVFYIAGVKL